MRIIVTTLMLLLVVHLLAALGFVGWLYQSERLDAERVQRVVEIFELTIDQEQRQQAEADRLEEQTRRQAEQLARLEAVSDGPRTLQDQLALARETDEVAQQRLERLQRETNDLRRQIVRAQEQIARERQELEAQRQAFEAALEREQRLREDDDFRQAVQMYEQLRPAQVKQMFQHLMDRGQTQQVVDYLAAMQLRRAGRVVQEFRDDDNEIEQAAELIERLRQRGVNLMTDNGSPGDDRL